jgi:opacity protein-like surface antigen
VRRRAVLVGVVILFLSPAGYALDPVGPPQALLGQGNWGLGVEYSYSETRVVLNDGTLVGACVLDDSTQLQAHASYVNLRYGVSRNVDVFARLGAAKIDLPLLQEGDAGFAWGLGAAVTIYHAQQLDGGLLVQFSRGQSQEHNPATVWTRAAETQVQSLQVAAGPTYRIREDLAVYGGAFYHLLWGDYESTLTRWDLKADHPFGAFAGLDWHVKEDAHWSVELQYAGATFAIAAGLRWIFD